LAAEAVVELGHRLIHRHSDRRMVPVLAGRAGKAVDHDAVDFGDGRQVGALRITATATPESMSA
jgi:hypothetical protein